MKEKQTYLDWSFGWQWLVSCAIGTAVLGLAAYGSMWQLGEAVAGNNEVIRVSVAGGLLGAFIALGSTLGPGLLLRGRGISAGRWVGYSVAVAGAALSSGTTLIASQNYAMQEAAISALFLGLAFGLPTGLVQWYLLKQQAVSATIWPLITVAAYLLAFGIVVFFSVEGREWIVSGGMGLALGTITGLGMMWLLRRETAVAA
jgi:hypothetical protein